MSLSSIPKEETLLAGRYLLVEEIGSGGMGTVYRSTDLRTGGPVAVKLLHPALARNAMYRERLRREAQIAASLTSPRVVRIVDLDEHEGIPFIVQEYVAGETLDRQLERDGKFPLLEALAIGREVARALEAAHAAGIVHRDLKPENIKLVDGQVKVLDFGIARADGIPSLTATNAWVGTVEFCAPERALGLGDIRSDVYSLGVILFALITGRLPFDGPTPMAIMRAHESAPPPIPDDLPHQVQAVLARCLAKHPNERYQTPTDLIADLGEAMAHLPATDWTLGPVGTPSVTATRPLGQPVLAGETSPLPTEWPPSSAMHSLPTPKLVPPNNLPVQVTSFVGRERERAEVHRLLSTARVITLAGPGGIGKTRLALQVAGEASEEYLGGAWLVPLATLGDPLLVPQAIADALGIRETAGRPLIATLAEWLRQKPLLLILDNCEHLVGACATLVYALTQSCPQLTLLATSREPLGIGGEVLWRVPPLDLQAEAVQLFAERATAARPGFEVTPDQEALVAEICWRLDGLPLAIELAAARVKLLSIEEIAARLDDRFRLLSSGSRTALPHQQTLRAAIEWSYDLLSDEEQVLFRRLGVFANGCTLDAAEEVLRLPAAPPPTVPSASQPAALAESPHAELGFRQAEADEPDVLEGLAALVDKSLLTHESGPGGDSRFVMLQTIREYALERLRESAEAAAVQERHLAYFLDLAEQADAQLRGRDQVIWLARLEVEHDNLRAALEWSTATPGQAARGLRLATTLGWFWYLRGQRSEGRARLEALLARPDAAAAPPTVRALALGTAAHLAFWGSDAAAALPLVDEACRLAVATDEPRAQAWALLYRAVVEPHENPADLAARWQESLALFRRAGDNWGVALSLAWLGWLAFRRGDVAEAIPNLEESQSLFRLLGDRWGSGLVLGRLANIADYQGEYARAEAYFEEQQVLARELGHKGSIAGGLSRLAALNLRRGDVAQARGRFEQSVALFRAIGEPRSTAAPLRQLARLLARYHHDFARAEALLAESLSVWEEHEGVIGPIRSLLGYVDLALLRGERDRAAHLLAAVEAEMGRRDAEFDAFARKQLRDDADDLRRQLAATGNGSESEPAAGEPMALADAIIYALGTPRQAPKLPAPGSQFSVDSSQVPPAHREAAPH
jgi:non-specific serine/threonine protein kinase